MPSSPLQGFPEDGDEGKMWRQPRVTLRHVVGNPSHSGVLREAGVAEADAVIVGSANSLEAKEVLSLLHVNVKYARSVRCAYLVAEPEGSTSSAAVVMMRLQAAL